MAKDGTNLDTIAALVRAGKKATMTGRQLLAMFGAERRGSRVVARIRGELLKVGLRTEPDFDEVWVDVPIEIVALAPASSPKPASTPDAADPPSTVVDAQTGHRHGDEPVMTIGRLPAANKPVSAVSPSTSLAEAMTRMLLSDFSQLPVLQNDRDCKGAVTWQSIAQTIALGQQHDTVNHCMVPVQEVQWNDGLLTVIPKVASTGFVLVRSKDRRFQGTVTVADLSLQFMEISEPFMLLGQIENCVRSLIAPRFTLEELRGAKNPLDTERTVDDVSDLTFGEYVRLLEPLASWSKLGVAFARAPFLTDLKAVQSIRNDVMHFDPDPLGESDIRVLRTFAAFMERTVQAQVTV